MPFKKGVTLIEIIIGIFVFSLLSTAAYFIFSYGMKVALYNSTRVQVQHNARLAMERIVTEVKNATIMPSQPGYTPDSAPSAVHLPALITDKVVNIICFSEPRPLDTGTGTLTAGFEFGDMDSYRLVNYYIEYPAEYTGANDYPTEKSEADRTLNNITALKRSVVNLTIANVGGLFDNNWRITEFGGSLVNPVPGPISDADTADEEIIVMPYATDFIHFRVLHEIDSDYALRKQVEFRGTPYETATIYDPLLYKIEMVVVQYPQGEISNPPQKFEMDAMIQVKSSY